MSLVRHASLELDSLEGLELLGPHLNLGGQGFGFVRLLPGQGYPFWHRHEKQVDVYLGLEGEATLLVDDREIPIARGDCVAVAPDAARILGNRGPRPCLLLVTGAPEAPWSAAAEEVLLGHDGAALPGRRLPNWTAAAPPDPAAEGGGPEDL